RQRQRPSLDPDAPVGRLRHALLQVRQRLGELLAGAGDVAANLLGLSVGQGRLLVAARGQPRCRVSCVFRPRANWPSSERAAVVAGRAGLSCRCRRLENTIVSVRPTTTWKADTSRNPRARPTTSPSATLAATASSAYPMA